MKEYFKKHKTNVTSLIKFVNEFSIYLEKIQAVCHGLLGTT